MKNLHLIATDKPSRLQLNVNTKNLILFNNIQSNNESVHLTNQNIYITSDEEIKFDDYIIDGYRVWQWKDNSSLLGRKKVILTTDQDLIKDGVQGIDDDFLDWFVNNPSCESVAFKIGYLGMGGFIKTDEPISKDKIEYKIVIPKEEPKQELPIVNGSYGCTVQTKKQELKQETLEEAAERILGNNIDGLMGALNDDDLFYFYKGVVQSYGEAMAKYQSERMYSEEELESLLHRFRLYSYNHGCGNAEFEEWFNQFKKK